MTDQNRALPHPDTRLVFLFGDAYWARDVLSHQAHAQVDLGHEARMRGGQMTVTQVAGEHVITVRYLVINSANGMRGWSGPAELWPQGRDLNPRQRQELEQMDAYLKMVNATIRKRAQT